MTEENRVALVTAGTGELGLAVARRLKADGLRVAVLDRPDPISKAIAEHNDLVFVGAEPGQVEGMQAAVEEVARVFGGLDVLVHAAGGDGARAQALGCLAWPQLTRRAGGRLIGVVEAPKQAWDDAAPPGLGEPVRAQALAGAPHGLTVNAICLVGPETGRPEPEEVAALVGYLVSPAGRAMTGAWLVLSGPAPGE